MIDQNIQFYLIRNGEDTYNDSVRISFDQPEQYRTINVLARPKVVSKYIFFPKHRIDICFKIRHKYPQVYAMSFLIYHNDMIRIPLLPNTGYTVCLGPFRAAGPDILQLIKNTVDAFWLNLFTIDGDLDEQILKQWEYNPVCRPASEIPSKEWLGNRTEINLEKLNEYLYQQR